MLESGIVPFAIPRGTDSHFGEKSRGIQKKKKKVSNC